MGKRDPSRQSDRTLVVSSKSRRRSRRHAARARGSRRSTPNIATLVALPRTR